MKQKAFTLIELLVALALIAILATIFFPVFAQARQRAQPACINNVAQIANGMMIYAQDYDENWAYPYWTPNIDNWCGDGATWRHRILPYLHNQQQVYVCPQFKHAGGLNDPADCINSSQHRVINPSIPYVGNYGMNAFWSEGYDAPGTGSSISAITQRAKVSSPGETILISENTDGDWTVEPEAPNESQSFEPANLSANDPPERKTLPALAGCSVYPKLPYGISPLYGTSGFSAQPGHIWTVRHTDGGNIGFMDGHTKWLTRSDIYQQGTSTNKGACYLWHLSK